MVSINDPVFRVREIDKQLSRTFLISVIGDIRKLYKGYLPEKSHQDYMPPIDLTQEAVDQLVEDVKQSTLNKFKDDVGKRGPQRRYSSEDREVFERLKSGEWDLFFARRVELFLGQRRENLLKEASGKRPRIKFSEVDIPVPTVVRDHPGLMVK